MLSSKRALVLHGYRGTPYVNWYPWLAWKLRRRGFITWAPWLPMSSFPNGRTWTHKLLNRQDWDYNKSLVIGHSAGAVELLNLLSNLPNDQQVNAAVFVSIFRPKAQWPALKKLVPEELDFERIRENANQLIFVHAQNDPLVPVADAKYYAKKLGGELIILPDGGHFSILRNLKFWRFPKLMEIIENKVLK